MTDTRYSHLHYSDAAIRMLEFAFEDEEQQWGKMVGFDESIEIPYHLQPPNYEDSDILPSKQHPSYPYGRPDHLSHPPTTSSTRVSLSRARGRQGVDSSGLLGRLGMAPGSLKSTKTMWNDFGLHARTGFNPPGLWAGLLEEEGRAEIPAGMAGAKRPPTPSSPGINPSSPSTSSSSSAFDPTPPASPRMPSPEMTPTIPHALPADHDHDHDHAAEADEEDVPVWERTHRSRARAVEGARREDAGGRGRGGKGKGKGTKGSLRLKKGGVPEKMGEASGSRSGTRGSDDSFDPSGPAISPPPADHEQDDDRAEVGQSLMDVLGATLAEERDMTERLRMMVDQLRGGEGAF